MKTTPRRAYILMIVMITYLLVAPILSVLISPLINLAQLKEEFFTSPVFAIIYIIAAILTYCILSGKKWGLMIILAVSSLMALQSVVGILTGLVQSVRWIIEFGDISNLALMFTGSSALELWLNRLVSIAFNLSIAFLSYKLLEHPFYKREKHTKSQSSA